MPDTIPPATGAPAARVRTIIAAASRPSLPRHIKLRHDPARGRWLILAPERVFEPDDTAVAVLRLCDGQASVTDVCEALAREYAAPPSEILADVVAMLQDLADKGIVRA
jgi:pyrroloquinoline quinone biosynthesis protein D